MIGGLFPACPCGNTRLVWSLTVVLGKSRYTVSCEDCGRETWADFLSLAMIQAEAGQWMTGATA